MMKTSSWSLIRFQKECRRRAWQRNKQCCWGGSSEHRWQGGIKYGKKKQEKEKLWRRFWREWGANDKWRNWWYGLLTFLFINFTALKRNQFNNYLPLNFPSGWSCESVFQISLMFSNVSVTFYDNIMHGLTLPYLILVWVSMPLKLIFFEWVTIITRQLILISESRNCSPTLQEKNCSGKALMLKFGFAYKLVT